MVKVNVLILRAPGTNCDEEAAFAFEDAGGTSHLVDVGELIRREKSLRDYQIMVIPGGFTYGDDIAAGKVLANELRLKLSEQIPDFVERGGLIIGICNGLQVLVKAGILPGLGSKGTGAVTLWNNDSGKFECRWVHLAVNRKNPCVFTKGIEHMYLPVAHGEGKVIAIPEAVSSIKPVLWYTDAEGNKTAMYPDNPNGSLNSIAGVCDETGRIFALMPHPERHIRVTQHPNWTRRRSSRGHGDGFRIFDNAVKFAWGK